MYCLAVFLASSKVGHLLPSVNFVVDKKLADLVGETNLVDVNYFGKRKKRS